MGIPLSKNVDRIWLSLIMNLEGMDVYLEEDQAQVIQQALYFAYQKGKEDQIDLMIQQADK